MEERGLVEKEKRRIENVLDPMFSTLETSHSEIIALNVVLLLNK